MANVNQVIIVGNLTHDPELRRARSSARFSTFGVALDERRKTPLGELVAETTFVDVTAWCQLAEFITERGRKGDTVLVVGRLRQDRDTGKLGIVAERLQLFGEPEAMTTAKRATTAKRSSGARRGSSKPTCKAPGIPAGALADDLGN